MILGDKDQTTDSFLKYILFRFADHKCRDEVYNACAHKQTKRAVVFLDLVSITEHKAGRD